MGNHRLLFQVACMTHGFERRASNHLTLFALQRRMRAQFQQVFVRAHHELERLRAGGRSFSDAPPRAGMYRSTAADCGSVC